MNQQRTEAVVFWLTKGPPQLERALFCGSISIFRFCELCFAAAVVIGNQSSSN